MSGQFNYVLEVEDTYEAERIAAELHLSREQYKICRSESDLYGKRLPTKQLLFILPALREDARVKGLIITA